jgi:hypothetical protein
VPSDAVLSRLSMTMPDAELEIYGEHRLVRARVVEGDERAAYRRAANREHSGFDRYEARTARDIKVFAHEPA